MTLKNVTFTENEINETVLITEDYGSYKSYLEVSYTRDWRNKKEIEFHYRSLTSPHDPLARWVGRDRGYVQMESIEKAEKKVKTLINRKERIRRAGRKTVQYQALLSETNGKIKHFREDLTKHDAYLLGKENPDQFLFSYRETGTHMFTKNWDSLDWRKAVVSQRSKGEKFFMYANGKLTEIEPETWAGYWNTIFEGVS